MERIFYSNKISIALMNRQGSVRQKSPLMQVYFSASRGFAYGLFQSPDRGADAPEEAVYIHLLQPQFLQMLQPPSKVRGSPHSGQSTLLRTSPTTAGREAFFSAGVAGASQVTGALSGAVALWLRSACTSLYISNSALPTAMEKRPRTCQCFRVNR